MDLIDSKTCIFTSSWAAKSIKLYTSERYRSLYTKSLVAISSLYITSKWGINIFCIEINLALIAPSLAINFTILPWEKVNLLKCIELKLASMLNECPINFKSHWILSISCWFSLVNNSHWKASYIKNECSIQHLLNYVQW